MDGHWEHGTKIASDQKKAHNTNKKGHEKHHHHNKD